MYSSQWNAVPPLSSLGRSIAAYQPYYAPPAFPQTNYINGGSRLVSANAVPAVYPTYGRAGAMAGIVNSRNRTAGMGWLYSYGARAKKWFQEIATGAVQSTAFQPLTSSTAFNMWNGELYAVGYPRNLGWSEKVPTIPKEALGNNPWGAMQAAPQFTRNIFTRRSFSTAPSLPAKPQNG